MAENTENLVSLFTNTFISHKETDTPFRLIDIFTKRLEGLEIVANDILDLVDIDNLYGLSMDNYATKWGLIRNGLTDDNFRQEIYKQISVYYSGSTIFDFRNIMAIFAPPMGSYILENVPPEIAEINAIFNSASSPLYDRIMSVLRAIKAGGVQLEGYNPQLDSLLQQDSFGIMQQLGDAILLEYENPIPNNVLSTENDSLLITENDNLIELEQII